MCVYAVVSLRRRWFTGARHINKFFEDEVTGIITLIIGIIYGEGRG